MVFDTSAVLFCHHRGTRRLYATFTAYACSAVPPLFSLSRQLHQFPLPAWLLCLDGLFPL